ncbi:MAG TPA: 2-hydroxyacyl-CoA dehydratase family protein [Planctomycetota bacterium]|jgi:benzoyl-CoA reductase/2-hydroxyglutaryl-CoA dehydratase subunit BcrC/BadD/HgdB
MDSVRVLYSSPFVPAEWIAAHSLQPQRLFPGQHAGASFAGGNEGLCPYAKAFSEEAAADGSPVVFATTCDQMRRASEAPISARPTFLFNMPATWETSTAQTMYCDELLRLSRFLVRLGGKAPRSEHLARIMKQYDGARADLRSLWQEGHAKEALLGLIALSGADALGSSLLALGSDDRGTQQPRAKSQKPRARLALVGGPLLREQFALFDELAAWGAEVVLDATETGERTLPDAFDATRMGSDPFAELQRAYFGSIPDAFRRPNDLLYRWLAQKIAERGVRGIVLVRCVWCDLWHAELQRMKERFNLPVVELDQNGTSIPARDGEMATGPSVRTRLQALLEVFT